jgi:hypothetical protein
LAAVRAISGLKIVSRQASELLSTEHHPFALFAPFRGQLDFARRVSGRKKAQEAQKSPGLSGLIFVIAPMGLCLAAWRLCARFPA